MEILFIVGRVLFGGFFVLMAFNHFTKSGALAGYAASKGVPLPMLAVFGTGILLFIGGVGMLAGIYVEYAAVALVLFLVPVSLKIHNFWAIQDPMQKMIEKINFQKNIALAGAALMILYLWSNGF